MSHQTPPPPADSLERALGDMRQSVAARGDEGWVDRVLMAGIWLALLSILDTLIGLLADFRAGTLPPILPARERSVAPAERETKTPRRSTAGQPRVPGDARANAPRDAGTPGQSLGAHGPASRAARTPRRPAFTIPPPRLPLSRPEPGVTWSLRRAASPGIVQSSRDPPVDPPVPHSAVGAPRFRTPISLRSSIDTGWASARHGLARRLEAVSGSSASTLAVEPRRVTAGSRSSICLDSTEPTIAAPTGASLA